MTAYLRLEDEYYLELGCEQRFGADSLAPLGAQNGDRSKHRILDDGELEQLEDPSWLISGMLPAGGLGILVGPGGSAKTGTALDMGMAISGGVPWFGRPVKQGSCLFIVAEGLGGMKSRLAAQKSVRGVSRCSVYFYPEALPLMNLGAVMGFVDAVQDRLMVPPAIVVVDTWARCLSPGDENSAQDTGIAIRSIDLIRSRTGAAVLALHHPSRAGEAPRGSGALEGAADTVWALRDEEGLRVLECRKMKDSSGFDPIKYRLVSAGVSFVLGSADASPEGPSLTQSQRRVLDALRAIDVGAGDPTSELEATSRLPRATFFRVRKQLSELGLAVEKKHRWRLTLAGETATVSQSHWSPKVIS